MFEYKVERVASWSVADFLNGCAKDGWECFGAHPDPDDYLTVVVYLKRENPVRIAIE